MPPRGTSVGGRSAAEIDQPSSAPARPRPLIVTVLGAFLRRLGGWMAVADLIALMESLGVEERAVRSSVSRLKRRGFVVPERPNGVAGYMLSEDAKRILAAGDRRIFRERERRAVEGWVVVVFSIPESRREQRHVLRTQLTWLGFGSAAARVWIAPAHLEEELRDMVERHGFERYVSVFRAGYTGFSELPEAVAEWWDLPTLARLYDDFILQHSPVVAAWRRRSTVDPERAFADYVGALTHWRRLPFLDPGLPSSLLPPDWSGERAETLFGELHDLLGEPAFEHVEAVAGRSGRPAG
jgi:phenylacetic acid degradation operon negative regulatory protein